MGTTYFKTDNFTFKQRSIITNGSNDRVTLAPKESAILNLLLKNANKIISKNDIISHAWKGGVVSDASLIRCIYVLRKALGHSRKNRIIETIYGKGYRLLSSVQTLTEMSKSQEYKKIDNKSSRPENCTIALLPFELNDKKTSTLLHDRLVDFLHEIKDTDSISIEVVSSYMTSLFKNHSDLVQLLEKADVNYYITGTEISFKNDSIIRVELVKAKNHSVLHRESIHINKDQNSFYRTASNAILNLLTLISADKMQCFSSKSDYRQDNTAGYLI